MATDPTPPAPGPGPGPRPVVRRMDAVRQALLLFVHSKLTMCPDHRFAFASIGETVSMVLIYCRSSTKPHHQWPVKPKNFTLDIIYLHDKPTADNCPQKVYDALVDALEHVSQYEGYILETGQGLARVLFRLMCILLSHPLQRCIQDDLDIPKQVAKKTLAVEAAQNEDGTPVSS
ncbi:hypothetical protein GQ55_4G337100 [Panicum hallii var. hallii]|uniref:BRISC and BRCA1-A complex member 1 n=1 Tax=Panicum hallii var. hallii TaxID=1504633 RepID=A0A2T7E2X3_9POAL|nr:hypothetical protein GQ55_4G337100 [Panicum hallii var. hallii]